MSNLPNWPRASEVYSRAYRVLYQMQGNADAHPLIEALSAGDEERIKGLLLQAHDNGYDVYNSDEESRMKLTAADEQLARTVAAMDVCGSPTGQYAADVREDSNRRYTSYCVKASNGPPVRLAPADGRPRLVACKARIGCFALHRPWGWKQKDGPVWNVTHESSGLAAATQVRTLPTARAIAKRLMADFADQSHHFLVDRTLHQVFDK